MGRVLRVQPDEWRCSQFGVGNDELVTDPGGQSDECEDAGAVSLHVRFRGESPSGWRGGVAIEEMPPEISTVAHYSLGISKELGFAEVVFSDRP